MGTGRSAVPAVVLDGVVAVGVAVLMLGTALGGSHSPGRHATGVALLVAAGLALAARRHAPLAVLALTGLCAIGGLWSGLEILAVPYLVAVYSAVRAGHRVVTAVASVVLIVLLHLTALLVHDASLREAMTRSRETLEIAWLIAAFAAGEAVRQAERRADEAERTREQTARRRADEERLRIARELHDSLTHQISVITVQSEAVVHVARRRGEDVPEPMLAIRDAARSAGRELRTTLEALRSDAASPAPGLDRIPALVDQFRATGLPVTLTVDDAPPSTPAAVGTTAYRIVQESLTNTARHASATNASVHIGYRPDALTVRVSDNGCGPTRSAPQPGLGLTGMQERVNALGGRLHAGPHRTGGFTVRADLPMDGDR